MADSDSTDSSGNVIEFASRDNLDQKILQLRSSRIAVIKAPARKNFVSGLRLTPCAGH